MPTLLASTRFWLAFVFIAHVFLAAGSPAAAQSDATGRNVTVVEFGRKLGELRQTGPGQWVETNAAGQVAFRFEETKRDDSSVSLLDRSRNVTLQLDLKTRKVMYSAGGAPLSELYAVLSAAATPLASATPAAPAAPTASAPGGARTCQIFGLMHVTTFDTATFDAFRSAGVVYLVESEALTVQARLDSSRINRAANAVAAVALRVGGTILVFDSQGPSQKSAASAGVIVTTPAGNRGREAKFQMQDGSLVSINRDSDTAPYNVAVSVPASATGKVRGICGNFDRNAQNDNPPAGNPVTTWTVPDNRNLFACGASCAGFK